MIVATRPIEIGTCGTGFSNAGPEGTTTSNGTVSGRRHHFTFPSVGDEFWDHERPGPNRSSRVENSC